MDKSLAEALFHLERDYVLEEVTRRFEAGDDAMELIRELQDGMGRVGKKFEDGKFYLAELMLSADLFKRAMAILEPGLDVDALQSIGTMVVGTPKGDIHDIGKNIFCTVAKSAGFKVHDLGVDVAHQSFLSAVEEIRPDIVGFSALLTTAFEPMKEIVDALTEKGLRQDLKIIVGGGVTTETVRKYVGADAQTIDAMDGLNRCKRFVGA